MLVAEEDEAEFGPSLGFGSVIRSFLEGEGEGDREAEGAITETLMEFNSKLTVRALEFWGKARISFTLSLLAEEEKTASYGVEIN